MKKQTLKSVTGFAVVLMVLSIIPSCALASENGNHANQTNSTNEGGFGKMMPGCMRHGGEEPDGMHGVGFVPAANITDENFTEVQAEMLNSITEKIAELQSMYNNVSNASTAEELQEAILAERPANIECAGPGRMTGFPGEVFGPCLYKVENLTEENFTAVQTEMLTSLQNTTEDLEKKQTQLTEAGEKDRAEELNDKIAELQNLSAEMNEASNASELKEVVFSYMQTQIVTSLEKEIEFFNARIIENGNTTDEQLENRITELTALIADVQGTESLGELREVMSSEMKFENGPMQEGKGPMHHDGHGKMPMCPYSLQNNSTEI